MAKNQDCQSPVHPIGHITPSDHLHTRLNLTVMLYSTTKLQIKSKGNQKRQCLTGLISCADSWIRDITAGAKYDCNVQTYYLGLILMRHQYAYKISTYFICILTILFHQYNYNKRITGIVVLFSLFTSKKQHTIIHNKSTIDSG